MILAGIFTLHAGIYDSCWQWHSYTRANPGLARVKFALARVKFALAHVKMSTQFHALSRPSHCAR